MNFRVFTESIKASVRRVGQGFTDPDDDWMPFLFVEFEGEGITPIQLPPEAFANADAKQMLSDVIALTASAVPPRKLAMVSSTWQVKFDKHEYRGDDVEPLPSEHPRRFEAVMVIAMDAERVEGHMAVIHRRRRLPPKLGPWETWPPKGAPPDAGLSGRFVEPWQEALR